LLRIRGEARKDFAAAGRHSRAQSLLFGTALREDHKRPSRQHRSIGPSGATAGAAVGADADPLAAADVAAGVVGARVPVVFFRVGAAAGVFVSGGAAAAGGAGAEASLGLGGVAAVGAGAAAPEAGVAIALTALRQGGDNLGSLRTRHSRASLPPGCTPAQLAMKSERQAARTASRCAWVGCCAAVGASVAAMKQLATSEDLNIEPSLAYSGPARMPATA
jgi:hypothetical protein